MRCTSRSSRRRSASSRPASPIVSSATTRPTQQYVDRLADELEAEFQRLGPDTVIAFIAEPVVGATTGCVAALPGYFRRVREICDRHGALLILDEVMCGMGRTGTMHAWEQEGIAPDLQVVAKGLGGGYQPIGGVLIGGRIVACDRRTAPAASCTATPTRRIRSPAPPRWRCSASSARTTCWSNVRAMGARLETALTERFGNHRHVGDVRGRGLFWALEFVADRATKQVFDPA